MSNYATDIVGKKLLPAKEGLGKRGGGGEVGNSLRRGEEDLGARRGGGGQRFSGGRACGR